MGETTSLGEIANINPLPPARIREDLDALASFVPMSAVSEDGRLLSETARPVSELLKGYNYFEAGDLLLAKITPCFENGKAALVESLRHEFGFGSTEFHVLRPGPALVPRYLYHLVRSPFFRMSAARSMTGTAGQKRVPADFVRRYRFTLPTLAEQRRIADILDRADAMRRKRADAIQMASEFLSSAFLETFGDPDSNPRGWPSRQLTDLIGSSGSIVDGPFGSSLKPECYVDAGVRVIRNFNIGDDLFDDSEFRYVTPEKFSSIKRSEVRPGDVLISTKGTVGNVCLMPPLPGPSVLSASGTVRIRLSNSAGLTNEILVSQMILPSFKRQVESRQAGSNQKYLNLSAIKSFKVIVPPLELQNRFSRLKAKAMQSNLRLKQAAREADTLARALQSNAFGPGIAK